jgi:hippurate hydrolase
MAAGPIAVVYNVDGVKDLTLSTATLAKIFSGAITNWNDDAIKKENPKAALPSAQIEVFYRKDESGTTDNIIPEYARLWGTLRTLSERTRATALEGIERVATMVAAAHGAECEVTIEHGFPVTVNDGRVVALVEDTAKALFGEGGFFRMNHPLMGAEDFSYLLQRAPGAMAFLGAAPDGGDYRTCCALHSNRMVIDETVMARGIAMHCAMAEAMLNGSLEP